MEEVIDFPDYEVREKLHESSRTVVYRGRMRSGGRPIILKMLASSRPTARELGRFRREFEIGCHLKGQEFPRILGRVEDLEDRLIVQEDFGGESLNRTLKERRFDIDSFLTLAIAIATAVGKLHEQGVIHRDLNPSNIVWNPSTGQVKLIDFGLSIRRHLAHAATEPARETTGTLAYISPEQTGRTNRLLDYRADHYSLGATFYELLTGRRPFEADDPMQMIYLHLACQPRSPDQVRRDVPCMVAKIIMTLLSKAAEERYQSAHGLIADLERCQEQWRQTQGIDEFELRTRDVGTTLRISQRLHGRQEELAQLQKALARSCRGERILAFVSGAAGVGKSMLVDHLQTPALESHAWFVSGKFDAQRAMPYGALGQAMGQLVNQLLSSSEAELRRWRQQLEERLGGEVALLAGIAPQLESVMGRPIEQQSLDFTEAHHRFRRALLDFIDVFCGADHPLVVVVDDLQWADEASLELIDLLMSEESLSHLLIVATGREPVDDGLWDLNSARADLGQQLVEIGLTGLGSRALANMVADSIDCSPEEARPLAEVIVQKTSGNPYFVGRFLSGLVKDELLTLDIEGGRWCWDLESIRSLPATENVVDVLSRSLEGLGEATCRVLAHAALLGSRFSLQILAAACDESPERVSKSLEPAIEIGGIYPLTEQEYLEPRDPQAQMVVREFRFAHDRVREAAIGLWSDEQRTAAHLRIGRLLQRHQGDSEEGEICFAVLEHLNRGAQLLDDRGDRLALSRQNLEASARALEGQAVELAVQLLEMAQQLLPDDAWQQEGDLTRRIALSQARATSLLGRFARAEELVLEALERLEDPVERAPFEAILVHQWTLDADYERALERGVQALEAMGYELPIDHVDRAISQQMERLDIERVAELAETAETDDAAGAALRLLAALQSPAGMIDLRLVLLIGLKGTAITAEGGLRQESAPALATYAMALCAMGNYEQAFRIGTLAIEVARRFDNQFNLSHACFNFGAFIVPWVRPLAESLDYLEEASRSGMRAGNYLFAGYAGAFELIYRFYLGEPIAQVRQRACQVVEMGRRLRHQAVLESGQGLQLLTSNLLGLTDSADSYHDEEFPSAQAFVDSCQRHDNQATPTTFSVTTASLAYLYGDAGRSLAQLRQMKPRLDAVLGSFDWARHTFYLTLSLIELVRRDQVDDRRRALEEVDELQEQIEVHARRCPENFGTWYRLILAERAWLDGQMLRAMDLFDETIEEAQGHRLSILEGLANERAGLFWLDQNKPDFAAIYLRAARYAYRLWGATRKVARLEEEHAQLIGRTEQRAQSDSAHSSSNDGIDVANVLKASELIASRVDLDELLPTLMRVTLETAGAERGAFLVAQDGALEVAVEGEAGSEPITYEPRMPLSQWSSGPHLVVRYVHRTAQPVVMGSACQEPRFRGDTYLQKGRVRSVICLPAAEQGDIRGVLYAENNLADDAFSEERTRVLQILADHIAISLNKARLYADLHERKEQFRQLAENIEEVFWLMEWPSREIVYVSPAYETVWSRPLPQRPISIEEWVNPVIDEDRHKVARALAEDAPLGRYEQTYRIEDPGGHRRWIRDRGFPIRRGDGRTFRIAGVAMDITGEHEVAQMKEEFISVVSHELRTPLTPITGIFSILADDYEEQLPDNIQDMARLGMRNSRRLLNLIDDLLDIQKLSMDKVNFRFEVVDVAELLEEAVRSNEALGDSRGISFELCKCDEVLEVHTDRDRLLQVVTNLLANAVKFSSDGDVIIVELTRVDRWAQIGVVDQGPGIPREARERIFEKFTQADSSLTRRHGGTGLGLAIANSIVTRLDGKLYFQTEEGEGTTFFVELPLASENRR